MDTFKRLKLKSYFRNLIIGVVACLTAAGILQAIILEVFKEYDPASFIAYACGGIVCSGILFYGFYEVIRAFTFEKRIFKDLSSEDVDLFFDEMETAAELTIPGQVVMTKSFLLVSVKDHRFACIIPKDELAGCFRTDLHHEDKATESAMILYDQSFNGIHVSIRGKGSEQAIMRLIDRICADMPWIYHEDYDEFLSNMGKIGHRRKMLKQMHDAKMRYETGYDSDTEAENELLAMSQDVKDKLDSQSLLERFLKKSK